jgi:DNA helicase-2/ATP-dependent DNA helicase PcrA
MEENIFPSPRSDSPQELSEERRLAYVAITRAKEAIYLTRTRERMLYGRTSPNPPSRFLGEIPKNLLKEEESPRTFAPPRSSYGGYGGYGGYSRPQSGNSYPSYVESRNSTTRASTSSAWRSDTATAAKKSPTSYGVAKLSVGTRVKHPSFGTGTILDARDMGGDVLYQVVFDSGETKKLMATYAKLEKE